MFLGALTRKRDLGKGWALCWDGALGWGPYLAEEGLYG